VERGKGRRVTVVLLMGVAYTVLLERKLVGRIQNRWGRTRGPFGLLQPLVDGAKSFLKEDIIPLACTSRSICWRRSFRWAVRCCRLRWFFWRAAYRPHGMDLFEISNLNIGCW